MAHKLELCLETGGVMSAVAGTGLEFAHLNPEGYIALGFGAGLFAVGAITELIRSVHDKRKLQEPLAKPD